MSERAATSIEQHIFQQLAAWLGAGQRSWLCTIVGVTGASPRPVGSLLACSADGGTVGSLSGGCVEEDLLERLRQGALAINLPQFIEYGVTPEQNERLGLPCGGRLEILVEGWSPEPLLVAQVNYLVELLQLRRMVRREMDLGSGQWRLQEVDEIAPLSRSDGRLSQCYGPRFQLLLVGAGETARSLALMAQMLDYRVLVCDPRRTLIDQWTGPDVELLCCMPDDAVRDYCRDDNRSIVVTLTHDPRIDDMALMEALRHDLFYVGALGSARTSAQRRERLRLLDLSDAEIAPLHAPVGLDIGSKRPPEIAIAILAELTALRARATLTQR